MTDKEKLEAIKAELITRKKIHLQDWLKRNELADKVAADITTQILGFVDSLPEEPVSEDLLSIHPCKVCKIGVKSTEEPVSEDLDRAAEKYAYELFPSIGAANTETELAFKAGAKWQKQQEIVSNNLSKN